MKILVFGSLNIDYVYDVDHIVARGETISSRNLSVNAGGKGLNQAVALGKAGADVYLAGSVGTDGSGLLAIAGEAGVNTELVWVNHEIRTGNAIIQRNAEGDNCIILYSGANRTITKEYVDQVIGQFDAGDYIVLQNEISELPYIAEKAFERGMQVILNPSPMDDVIKDLDLSKVSCLILNEIEAGQILGISDTDADVLLTGLRGKFPKMRIVLTLGQDGSVYSDSICRVTQEIYKVKTVDTTGAGDTFLGYFTAEMARGSEVKQAMDLASRASAMAVSKPGAAPSIPYLAEVLGYR